MPSVGDLNSALSTWLARADFTAQTFDDVNERALSKLKLDIGPVAQITTTTITNVAGQNAWALPADFLVARSITLDNNQAFLLIAPLEHIHGWNEQAETGLPLYFNIEGSNIVVSPDPASDVYTLNLTYLASLSELPNSDSTNTLTSTIPHLWFHLTAYYANDFIQDMPMAASHLQRYQEELRAFNRLQSRIRINGTSFRSIPRSRRLP